MDRNDQWQIDLTTGDWWPIASPGSNGKSRAVIASDDGHAVALWTSTGAASHTAKKRPCTKKANHESSPMGVTFQAQATPRRLPRRNY
jgi:hypothetical protein